MLIMCKQKFTKIKLQKKRTEKILQLTLGQEFAMREKKKPTYKNTNTHKIKLK